MNDSRCVYTKAECQAFSDLSPMCVIAPLYRFNCGEPQNTAKTCGGSTTVNEALEEGTSIVRFCKHTKELDAP